MGQAGEEMPVFGERWGGGLLSGLDCAGRVAREQR